MSPPAAATYKNSERRLSQRDCVCLQREMANLCGVLLLATCLFGLIAESEWLQAGCAECLVQASKAAAVCSASELPPSLRHVHLLAV
jgi:hypothetical protein